MSACNVVQNATGRWILTNPYSSSEAWTGSRWAKIDSRGFGIEIQISNFPTREEAEAYAWEIGFSN